MVHKVVCLWSKFRSVEWGSSNRLYSARDSHWEYWPWGPALCTAPSRPPAAASWRLTRCHCGRSLWARRTAYARWPAGSPAAGQPPRSASWWAAGPRTPAATIWSGRPPPVIHKFWSPYVAGYRRLSQLLTLRWDLAASFPSVCP